MSFEQLKLENQICFPVYAVSRLLTREYKPYLDELGLTYPQYLVLMVLWEKDGISVNEITEKLILNTNTITPLLKRMEEGNILIRKREKDDERRVRVELTQFGKDLQVRAAEIPNKLINGLNTEEISYDELKIFKSTLYKLIKTMEPGYFK